MKLDKKHIGKKLKEYRKKAKITQEEVSMRVDIDEKHYGKLERGLFTPSLESFFKLVDVLNIPLEEFDIVSTKKDEIKNELIKTINLSSQKENKTYFEIIELIKKLTQ